MSTDEEVPSSAPMLPKRFESGYKSSNAFSQMSDLVVLPPPKEKSLRSNRRRSRSESSYTVSFDDGVLSS